MFVYRMPILLGLLTPLALVQVYDLKDDRGTDGWRGRLTEEIPVRGEKFIRTDGESAIAALTVDLVRDTNFSSVMVSS